MNGVLKISYEMKRDLFFENSLGLKIWVQRKENASRTLLGISMGESVIAYECRSTGSRYTSLVVPQDA